MKPSITSARNLKKTIKRISILKDHFNNLMNVLVLCTGNSCRSQMAEAWLRHFGASEDRICSAGVKPESVNPKAIAVMLESGIDISRHTSDHVDSYLSENFDFVITVCDNAKEACPVFPGSATIVHHSFEDPAGFEGNEQDVLDGFRKVRDEIRVFCEDFLNR